MAIKTLQSILIRDINALKKEIGLFSDEHQIWQSLPGTTNSAGNLALHLIGNLRHFIGATLGNTGYIRNRDLEFSTKNLNTHQIISQIDDCILEISDTFKLISDEDLFKDYPVEFLGNRYTSHYVLVHLISHFNYHLGQINYHRRYFSSISGVL